jgi:phosphohistidine phosphatase
MSKLLLLRHAEASVTTIGGDCERPLTEAGRIEAARFGYFCLQAGLLPDEAIVSTALRTKETYAALTKSFPKKPVVSFETALYNASCSNLQTLIRQTLTNIETLLVVAHNPGLAELAISLVEEDHTGAANLAIMRYHFPTPALAVINFENRHWNEISPGSGHLECFLTSLTLHA